MIEENSVGDDLWGENRIHGRWIEWFAWTAYRPALPGVTEPFYNQRRRHSTLGQISPQHLNAKRAWTLASLWTRRTRPEGTWKTAQNAVFHSAHTHHRFLGLKKEG